MMIDLPSRNQASSEGPALKLVFGNNAGGGESILSNQYNFLISKFSFIYTTPVKENRVYTQLCEMQQPYI